MSLSAASEAKSSGRGCASRSQSRVSLCVAAAVPVASGCAPLIGRISYCVDPCDAAPGRWSRARRRPGGGTSGIGSVARRPRCRGAAAVTAVAVVVTCGLPSASACDICIVQCCVERLVRTGVAMHLERARLQRGRVVDGQRDRRAQQLGMLQHRLQHHAPRWCRRRGRPCSSSRGWCAPVKWPARMSLCCSARALSRGCVAHGRSVPPDAASCSRVRDAGAARAAAGAGRRPGAATGSG